uniref:Uncharacterized protein n=1 Tax=Rhizophora mucronata TaxID=61149 RepID=A0A2P2QVM4_RHIMU
MQISERKDPWTNDHNNSIFLLLTFTCALFNKKYD